MYNISQERDVFVTSLPFMAAAKAQALSKGMNDHGPLHAQRVHALVGYLTGLIDLSTHEHGLVCAAALLHDIGMAKDRENHHTESASIVRALVSEGKLPFSQDEADVVAKLCEWHRREYDANAIHEKLSVRTGVLASILRLADAMDLDYRRAEGYSKQEPVIAQVYQGQATHHLSARSILGVRFYASRMETEVQLLIDEVSPAKLQLERLILELIGTPVAWPVKLIPVRGRQSNVQSYETKRSALVFSYCNAHGVVQAGMSKRALELSGFSTTVVCDMKNTRDPFPFWLKTVTQWDFSKYHLVTILGLDLPSDIGEFLGLTKKYPQCRWVYATPLDQTHDRIAALLDAGVDILLGDARVLFAGNALPGHASLWTRIAGLCNADDWLTSSGGFRRQEYLAARGLRLELLKLVEGHASCEAFAALVNRVACDEIGYFVEQEPVWKSTLLTRLPDKIERRGRVVILHGGSIPGRFKYDLAYLAIEQQGVRAWDQNEFETPYAICRETASDGSERVLYLSRFCHADSAVPIKYFVPYAEHRFGSGSTIWHNYPSCDAANQAIESTVRSINEFLCEI